MFGAVSYQTVSFDWEVKMIFRKASLQKKKNTVTCKCDIFSNLEQNDTQEVRTAASAPAIIMEECFICMLDVINSS